MPSSQKIQSITFTEEFSGNLGETSYLKEWTDKLEKAIKGQGQKPLYDYCLQNRRPGDGPDQLSFPVVDVPQMDQTTADEVEKQKANLGVLYTHQCQTL